MKGSRANPAVKKWLGNMFEDLLHVSVITIGEIEKVLAAAERRGQDVSTYRRLIDDGLVPRFRERVLPFDEHCARERGRLLATMHGDRSAERALAIDAQIAATASRFGLRVCTRNIRDFEKIGITDFVDPFTA